VAGTIALVGAGEYLESMRAVDERLLARIAAPQKRVALLPTAAAPEPDFYKWSAMGLRHFTRIGAEARPVNVLKREDASNADLARAISEANFVYLSGGNPVYLLRTLQGTPVWEAIRGVWQAGGVIAGCSAGAMVMGGALRSRRDVPDQWEPALGLLPTIIVIPHFDRANLYRLMPLMEHVPEGLTLVGIDEHTAAICGPDGWEVMGRGGVYVFAGGAPTRYGAGERLPLPLPAVE
jgi:cyanophycinase